MWQSVIGEHRGFTPWLARGGCWATLEAAKRLREEEKKLLEEMVRMRRYYYLRYLPIIIKVRTSTKDC